MADLDRRLRRLERPAARDAGYVVVYRDNGESLEDAWSRQNPGEPLPTIPVVTVGWLPAPDPSPEVWAAWSRGDEDPKIVATTRARARGRAAGGGDGCA